MPAKSKQQQKFMGIVKTIQQGDEPASKFSKAAQDAAEDMKEKDVEDFASTKHKGLPKKVEQYLRQQIRKSVKEIIAEDYVETCGYTQSVDGKKLKTPGATGEEDRHLKEAERLTKGNRGVKVGDIVRFRDEHRRPVSQRVKVKWIMKAKPNKEFVDFNYITNKGTFHDQHLQGTKAWKLYYSKERRESVNEAVTFRGAKGRSVVVPNEYVSKLGRVEHKLMKMLGYTGGKHNIIGDWNWGYNSRQKMKPNDEFSSSIILRSHPYIKGGSRELQKGDVKVIIVTLNKLLRASGLKIEKSKSIIYRPDRNDPMIEFRVEPKQFNESVNESVVKKGVTDIKDIPNVKSLVNQKKVTYRGLGVGKLKRDFYKIAKTNGVRIRVKGKEYYITDKDFKKLGGIKKMNFGAPHKRESVSVEEERDYKAEYKKYGSSTKAKKYRAELNQYNRKNGTYGNGDGKDASHKGGKIVGFEKESTNRGRAEKSRLKKESVNERIMLKYNGRPITTFHFNAPVSKKITTSTRSWMVFDNMKDVKKTFKNHLDHIKKDKSSTKQDLETFKKMLKKIKMTKTESVNEARLDPKQLLQQLGGNRFVMMVGAKNLAVDKSKNELHMKIGRNAKGVSHVVIKLNAKDLYDMKFLQMRKNKIKIKSTAKDVYGDQLGKMFKKNTGMNVRL